MYVLYTFSARTRTKKEYDGGQKGPEPTLPHRLLLHRPLRAADEERLFCLVAYTHIVYDTKAKLIMYMGLAAASTVLLLSLLHRDLHAPRV